MQAEIFTAVLAAVFVDSGDTSLEAARKVCMSSGILEGAEALKGPLAAVPASQHAPPAKAVEGAQMAAPAIASRHLRLVYEKRPAADASDRDTSATHGVLGTQVCPLA